jgi:Fe2+ or Zn2+ uptake regulation protein
VTQSVPGTTRNTRQRAEEQAAAHGFTNVDHTFEIFGTCAACATPR